MKSNLLLALPLLLLACHRDEPKVETVATTTSAVVGSKTEAPATNTPVTTTAAKIGEAAPDFELADLDGKKVKLSSFKGKTVVLEWFNPGCPFVNKSHTVGSLKDLAKKETAKGVVWLAINSGAAGREGAGVDANRTGVKTYNLDHPVLLDENGAVGHAYGATNTPHIVVINSAGNLVYRGAIDNSPDAEGKEPTGGKLVNYVETTLTALAANKPVEVSETKAYGCSVKYAK